MNTPETPESPTAERSAPGEPHLLAPPPESEAGRPRRRWLIRLAVLAALGAGVGLVRVTVWRPTPLKVDVVSAARGRVEATVTNSRAGTVRARRRSQLSPETSGRVVEIAHREGETVAERAVLIRLDDTVPQAQVASAQAALATSRAAQVEAKLRHERAAREVERNRKLAKKSIISADVLDSVESAERVARAAYDTARARVTRAEANLAVAQAELKKTVLCAPFAGRVAEVVPELGEWIAPAPPMIKIPGVLDLIDPTSIYVSAPMDEVDSAVIRAGQRARVTLDPYPGKSFAAKVVRVATYVVDVEAQNRTVEVEVELDDKAFAAKLLPGTSADVEVILEKREKVLRIPAAALLEGAKVLVLKDGELVEREVGVGLKNWKYAEITKGLQEGERVVTSLDRAEVKAGARAVAR